MNWRRFARTIKKKKWREEPASLRITTGHSWISYWFMSSHLVRHLVPRRYLRDEAVPWQDMSSKVYCSNAWTPTRAILLTSPGHPSCHANRDTRFHSCRIHNSTYRARPTEISEEAFWPLESGPCIIERCANKIRTVSGQMKYRFYLLLILSEFFIYNLFIEYTN